jgi:glycosyltransferase involved in cell wall biosynthesis
VTGYCQTPLLTKYLEIKRQMIRKTLHVVPAAPFGGAQRLVIDLASQQIKAGAASAIVLTGRGDFIAGHIASKFGVPVIDARRRDGDVLRSLRIIRNAICSGVDTVHLHLPSPLLAFILPRNRKFNLISHLHVMPESNADRGLLISELNRRLMIRILRESDFLIAITEWVLAGWRSACPSVQTPASVIPNGILIAPQESPNCHPCRARRSEFVVGVASRLAPLKGMEEFITLAERIHHFAPEARFRIAGSGPSLPDLQGMAERLGLSDVIHFDGFISDLAPFWESIDIAAFTAPFEPFGLRLIEPLAHRVPVVAYTNGTGSDEVIKACGGIVSAPYGATEQLAKAAVALGRSLEQRSALAAVGYEDVNAKFSVELLVKRIENAYEAAASKRHAASLKKNNA